MSKNVRSVLVSAWNAIYPIESMAWDGPINSDNRDRFKQLLLAEAYTEAALMLVPDGWGFTVADYWCEGEEKPPYFADCIDKARLIAGDFDTPVYKAWADHPALALAQAALAAKGTSDTPHL